jgi:zinc protease
MHINRFAMASRAMLHASLAVTLATTLAAVIPCTAAAQFPTKPPAAAPIKAAAFPPFQEATLPNGLKLLVVRNAKQPVTAVTLAFAAGSAYDPAGKSGLADLTASLLTKGAGKRSADEVSAAIEAVGGSIGAGAGKDFLSIRADVLTGSAKLAFDLIADAVIRPTFADKELELARTQTLSGLQLSQSQPASLASRAIAKGLYGDHPYSRRADPASVQAIKRDDVIAFHKARLRPSGALLVVAGSLSLAEAQKLATDAFGSWTGAPATVAAFKAPPVRTATEIVLVHRPGSVQSNIVVGNLTSTPNDPRNFGASIANRILGGGADSRLFMILREQKSWTYGAYSSLNQYKGTGMFEATAEVRTDVTDSSLVEMLKQIKRIGDEPMPVDEFSAIQNSMTGQFPLTIESAGQVAAQVVNAKLLGRPSDYVATYRQKLSAVTPAQVQAAAKALFRRDAALIVVVGDGTKLYEKLKAIAPVKLVSAEGDPMKPEDLTVKSVLVNWDLSKLVPRSDSFAILVQGKPVGYQTTKLEKADGGWKYSEDTHLATFIQQHTEVRFTDKIVMQSVMQSGKTGGQDTKIDVTYANGHAKGTAAVPGPGGIKTVTVDADVPAGSLDDNIFQPMLAALRWAPGAKFTIPIFMSGKGSATTMNAVVGGEESVEVIAGKFDTWKVNVTGGDAPITMWLEKSTGRVVKLAPVGQPVEFQLVK